MPPSIKIKVYQSQQEVYSDQFTEPLELGRQQKLDEKPFVRHRESGGWRVAIARRDESSISRRHVLLEPLGDGRIRVSNVSTANTVVFSDGQVLAATQVGESQMPLLLTLGEKTVRIETVDESGDDLHSLMQPTLVPGQGPGEGPLNIPPLPPALPNLAEGDTESVIHWLQTVTAVLQSAASSTDFFQRAAQGVVDLVGLDSGRVLLWEEGKWNLAAMCMNQRIEHEQRAWQPSSQVLGNLRAEKRTFWKVPGRSSWGGGASMTDIQSVVAAPILDRTGDVIGALYGDRLRGMNSLLDLNITKLEAMLVETLACGVAAGLSRLKQEQAAIAAQVQFEQFVTPELARRLTADPSLLKGRNAEVTLLFCDVRGFSRISERFKTKNEAASLVEWISDIMNALSNCVLAERGTLVDYVGDELLAMWGAPFEQPEQAQLACRAALAMLREMETLNERWQGELGEPIRVGIGINTGQAHVGNTGSKVKLKYGPLGNTVNLASRVQGATKYLKADLLITEATKMRLDDSFSTRRLCQVRVVNIAEPVALYELRAASDAGWRAVCQGYEEGLREFEHQNFRKGKRILGNLLAAYPDDGPLHVLLSRIPVGSDPVGSNPDFDPVWELPGK